ncbi:hypothetical protein BBJ28_00014291 [Nothophytophthora sp. Chile5]|nr:hypothetical protein BBJ28_00014291 [Nothophytophthora sp. Chile5]
MVITPAPAPAPTARTVRTPPRPRPQPVSKSSRSPLAMSRTAASKTTGHAPSARMLDRMHEAAADLAALATASAGWRFAGDRNGTQLFEMAGRSLPPSVSTVRKFGRGAGHSSDFYLVRADVRVRADVGSMLDLLHSSTTEEFRLVARQIFQHHFHNGVTIDKLTCTTPPPFAPETEEADNDGASNMARRSFSQDDAYSVNWLTLLDGDSRRDFTLVSYQDAFLRSPDESNTALTRVGRGYTTDVDPAQPPNPDLVAVHVLSSVNFQDIPELPLPESTDRLHLRNSGFVIEPTADPGVLRMSLLLSLLPTKSTLRNTKRYQRWLQTLASCIGNLAQTVRPQVSVQCLDKRSWKASDHCFMCLKMFRTFRRCHHCRFCGEAVCGACSSMVNMAGYAISGDASASLGASAASSALSSRRLSASTESPGADIWHLEASMVTSRPSSSRGVKETRGCSACIADLQQNLAMSATMSTVMSRRSTASSFSAGRAALPRSATSLSTEEDDVVSYSSADELDIGRLGSLATYQSSERMRRPQQAAEMKEEPMDEFPLKAEELQDKFPAVDEPAPPRFRNVSDPDQLRRMRNGSDPELVLRLKDKQSMISMSTASSSFSRTSSHDQLDSASQYSRGTNFSATSDASSAGDLSRDPDILALAGLTLKPSSTAVEEPSDCSKQMKEQVPEEPEKEQEAEAEAHALQTQAQKVEKVQEEEEDVFKEEVTSSAWPGSSRSNVSSSSASAEARHRSNTASLRPERRMLHPADVLRHRSQTTASMAWNTAANVSLSSATSASTPSESSSHSSSSEVVKPAKTTTRPATGGTFHFSMMNSQPSSATAAIVAAVAAVGTPLQAPTAPTPKPRPATPEPVETVVPTPSPTTYMGSSKIYLSTAARRGSAPKQMQMMTRLPATISEGSVSGPAERNDMIMLPPKQPTAAEFVLFSDSERESILTRPDDGNDMIPLDF